MFRAAIRGVGTWGRTRVDSVRRKSDIIRFTDAVARGYGAFGFRKEDADLPAEFNAALGEILE